MAITILEKKKFQRNLIAVFIILISITAIIIWQGFFGGKKIKIVKDGEITKPTKVEINFSILEAPILKEFQPFEKIKSLEETAGIGIIKTGRENPFIPY